MDILSFYLIALFFSIFINVYLYTENNKLTDELLEKELKEYFRKR